MKKGLRKCTYLFLVLAIILTQVLALASVANAADTANLALGKTISANNYTQTYVATNANDGNVNTYWEGAANAYPNTLTVDLASAQSVYKVILKLNPSWGSRTQTLSVLSSTDNVNYTTCASSSTYTFNPSSSNTVTITITETSARYIRLNFTANSGATGGQCAEFEVYGTAATGTPDLVVTDISWSPASPATGNAVTFSATIKNQGTGATPAGVIQGVAFQIDGAGTTLWSDSYTSSIPAGSSVTVTVNGGTAGSTWTATSGTHSILAWVDDVNRIPNESNENNNQYTKGLTVGGTATPTPTPTSTPTSTPTTIPTPTPTATPTPSPTSTPTSGQPDLIVTDIAWSPASPTAGNAVTFSATIKNQGTGATPGGVIHGVAFQIDGAGTTLWSDTYTTSMPAGSTVTVTVNGGTAGSTWTAASGTHSILAWVDDVNRITNESNESNNQYAESLTIGTSSGDVVGKLYAGYQGWFNCGGDGSPLGGWNHWTTNSSAPTTNPYNIKFEIYPDIREYTNLYQTNLANLGNGQTARLFSSFDASTVNKHFEWMRDYNIDGAALQRFGASGPMDSWKQNRDSVAVKVKNAAESYGRKFYVMYDITGMPGDTWVSGLQQDWTNNIIGTMNLTASSAYAKQNGKPVVCIWGIGFTDRPGDAAQCTTIINWFKSQGCYVIGGVPTYWRQGINDSRSGFIDVYKSLNMISPWLVGRFGSMQGADDFKNNIIAPDYTYCQQNGIDYQPTMNPGFAWSNMFPGKPRNEAPRLHGDFMWRQAYNIKSLGISTGYIAMFDEYDEGTAIAKGAENSSMIPTNQYFLTYDADGVAVSSDFYLRLSGDINKLLKGQIPLTAAHPTNHQ